MNLNKIRVVLAEKQIRSKDLAEGIGVSQNSVSRWINNYRQPSVENLFYIADFLGVNAGDLLIRNLENKDWRE